MAKTVYFDCFSGASGDMVLGALLDLGLPLDGLRSALGSLAIEYGDVSAERVLRSGVSATKLKTTPNSQTPTPNSQPLTPNSQPPTTKKVSVETSLDVGSSSRVGGWELGVGNSLEVGSWKLEVDKAHHLHEEQSHHHSHHHHQDHHSLTEIRAHIERSSLSRAGKDRAVHLFQRLAEAEAEIHQVPLDKVHLHEVGAIDSIIDIVGAVYGMEWLGAEDIIASPLNVGSGTVTCAHGVFPVPAPATALLLRGAPIYSGAVASELVTPTGALLITDYARSFGPIPAMRLDAVGYGAGDRDAKGHPNVLRILVGEAESSGAAESVLVLECEIDDMNPQLFGPLMDRLFEAGAADVFYLPVQMKKSRPGTLVTVLCAPGDREKVLSVLFAETTTIGVRYQEMQRECLTREVRVVDTPVGAIRFKVASRGGRVLNASPEFEDCTRAAAEHHIAVKDVQAIATKAWLDRS